MTTGSAQSSAVAHASSAVDANFAPRVFHGIGAVIIDLDGTMVDTAPDFREAVNRACAGLGLAPLSLETVAGFVGQGSEHLMRQVLGASLTEDEVADRLPAALAAYLEHYRAVNGVHASVYPGVPEGLAALQAKGLRLACVTNKPLAFAEALLARCNLRAPFALVYGGDSFARRKPDPLPLQRVCNGFGLAPSAVMVIGDSSNDARAARAAGCPVLTVPYGYNHGQDVQSIDSDGIVLTLLDAASRINP